LSRLIYWLPDPSKIAFILVWLPAMMLIAHRMDGRSSWDWRFPIVSGAMLARRQVLPG
jgi:hypothetical protein